MNWFKKEKEKEKETPKYIVHKYSINHIDHFVRSKDKECIIIKKNNKCYFFNLVSIFELDFDIEHITDDYTNERYRIVKGDEDDFIIVPIEDNFYRKELINNSFIIDDFNQFIKYHSIEI